MRLHNLRVGAERRTSLFAIEFLIRAVRHPDLNPLDADIVHFHAGFFDYIALARMLATAWRKPLVYGAYCPAMNFELLTPIIRLSNSFAYPKVLISPISNNVKSFVQSIGILPDQIRVVPPALDVEALDRKAVGKARAREILGFPIDKPMLLFVGSFRPEKNLAGLIRAMSGVIHHVPDAFLVATTELNNRGDAASRQEVAAEIENRGLEEHVLFKGIVDEMPVLMCAADVCVFPFLHTRGPSDYFVAALEAMALGKPVVVSPVGAMPEVISGDEGVLADPMSTTDLSHSIVELLQDSEQRARMAAKAKRKIRSKFDVKRVAQEFDALYREVLE